MATLTDICDRLIELHDRPGLGIDVHAAVTAGVPLVMADAEAVEGAVKQALHKLIKDRATKQVRSEGDRRGQLMLFPDLRAAYALDVEGRTVKRTVDLSRLEFERLITVRAEQVVADTRHLEALRDARTKAAPMWDMHPAATFGEIVAMLAVAEQAA